MNDCIGQMPLSHTNDPQTSYNAADKMIKSGKLSSQEKLVFDAIRDYLTSKVVYADLTFTARELSDTTNIDYHLIQRRLSGLNNKGKIERVMVGHKVISRNGCCVWRLK